MDPEDKAFTAAFIAVLVVMLVVLGVGVWAIIQLVQWITSK